MTERNSRPSHRSSTDAYDAYSASANRTSSGIRSWSVVRSSSSAHATSSLSSSSSISSGSSSGSGVSPSAGAGPAGSGNASPKSSRYRSAKSRGGSHGTGTPRVHSHSSTGSARPAFACSHSSVRCTSRAQGICDSAASRSSTASTVTTSANGGSTTPGRSCGFSTSSTVCTPAAFRLSIADQSGAAPPSAPASAAGIRADHQAAAARVASSVAAKWASNTTPSDANRCSAGVSIQSFP